MKEKDKWLREHYGLTLDEHLNFEHRRLERERAWEKERQLDVDYYKKRALDAEQFTWTNAIKTGVMMGIAVVVSLALLLLFMKIAPVR